MANPYFQFKQFTIYHDRCAMKVTTDSCFFGAWIAREIKNARLNDTVGQEKLKIKNVLDIGTGTGLLSLMILQENELVIDAVEIDKEASQQAMENIEASPWKNQIHIFNEDIISFQPAGKYDCIVSNPPFYENELASGKLKKNIAHHSEQLTLSQVLTIIKTHLKEDGIFFLMYPFKRKPEVEQLFWQNEFYIADSVILKQSSKHSPFRIIVKATNKNINSENSTSIAIWDEHQQYTEQFIDSLKDYYLYL
jgi:tRNA1Val (adenine37-N6)-methyltransferase